MFVWVNSNTAKWQIAKSVRFFLYDIREALVDRNVINKVTVDTLAKYITE